jgi:hypothetical protein
MALAPKKPDAAQWPFPTGRRKAAASTAAEKGVSKPRATSEKRYDVTASLKNVELVKAGSALTLLVTESGSVLGKMEIGAGSFFWTAANKKRKKRVDWKSFAELMEQLP